MITDRKEENPRNETSRGVAGGDKQGFGGAFFLSSSYSSTSSLTRKWQGRQCTRVAMIPLRHCTRRLLIGPSSVRRGKNGAPTDSLRGMETLPFSGEYPGVREPRCGTRIVARSRSASVARVLRVHMFSRTIQERLLPKLE